MSNEALAGYLFLDGLFTGDATLLALVSGVFGDVAPDGTKPDWLVFGSQSASDTMTATAVRILTRNLYRVLAVGPVADWSNLKAIADRADALLQPGGQPLRNATQGGVTVMSVSREQALVLPEEIPGSTYGPAWVQAGGLYRIEK